MSENEPHHRLAFLRRQQGFATASEAARYYGWNENTYRSHENGERGMRRDVAFKYAQAFGYTANFLLFGDISDDELPNAERNFIQVVGQIKTDDKAIYFEGFFDTGRSSHVAHIKTSLLPQFIAFEVESGTSIQGIVSQSLLICLKDTSENDEAEGKLCVVYVKNESHDTYISKVFPNTDGKTVKVVSASGAIRDIEPNMIWQIIFIVPPGQWSGRYVEDPR